MSEHRDWMMVYRQGLGRSFKRSTVFNVTWEEARDAAQKLVEANEVLPSRSHFDSYFVPNEATRVWVRLTRDRGRYVPIESEV